MQVRLAVPMLLVALLPVGPVVGSPIARYWDDRAAEIRRLFEEKEWGRAERVAERLGREVMKEAKENDATPRALARVAAYRAAALAEMGKTDDAEWFWLAAQALSPEARDLDFRETCPHWVELYSIRPGPVSFDTRPLDPRIVLPKAIVRGRPAFPKNQMTGGTVRVHAILTTTGRLRNPVLDDSSTSSAAKRYSALETLVRWRYRPATLDGAPIEMTIDVVVNFKVAE